MTELMRIKLVPPPRAKFRCQLQRPKQHVLGTDSLNFPMGGQLKWRSPVRISNCSSNCTFVGEEPCFSHSNRNQGNARKCHSAVFQRLQYFYSSGARVESFSVPVDHQEVAWILLNRNRKSILKAVSDPKPACSLQAIWTRPMLVQGQPNDRLKRSIRSAVGQQRDCYCHSQNATACYGLANRSGVR